MPYTPFLGESLKYAGQQYAQRKQSDLKARQDALAGKALQGDPAALENLKIANPALGDQVQQEIQKRQQTSQQQNLQQMTGLNKDIHEVAQNIAKFGSYEEAKQYGDQQYKILSGKYPELAQQYGNAEFDEGDFQAAKNMFPNAASGGSVQFGAAQQLAKDSEGNIFYTTTKRNQKTGAFETVAAPYGGGTVKPVGELTPVTQLGQTATEKVGQIGEEAAARAGKAEEAKLGVQAKLLPNVRAAIKKAEVTASAQGAELTSLERAQAALPGLQEVTQKLKNLADVATYTQAGQAFDVMAKELGFGSTKGGTARAKMVSIVNNQVLPLLKDTFGAAFTEREGDTLKATLVDPNATPEAKKELLDAFIAQKIRDIETKQRQLGIPTEPRAAEPMSSPDMQSYLRHAQ